MPAVTLPVIWRRRAPSPRPRSSPPASWRRAGVGRCGAVIPAALLVLYTLGARARRPARCSPASRSCSPRWCSSSLTDPIIDAAALSFVAPAVRRDGRHRRAVRARTRLAGGPRRPHPRARGPARAHRRAGGRGRAHAARRRARRHGARPRARDDRAGGAAERGLRPHRAPRPRLAQRHARAARRPAQRRPRAAADARPARRAARRRPRPAAAPSSSTSSGEQRPLPGGVELTAYRIVEHALDGPDGGRSHVRLRYRPDALELELRGAPEPRWPPRASASARTAGASTLRRPAAVHALPVVAHV